MLTPPDQTPTGVKGDVHTSLKHDSAYLHVSGEARYIDDLPEPADCLHLYVAKSERAHARITSMDLSEVIATPGVVSVLTADDIPGINDIGPVKKDDPLFADGEALYHGQCLFAVAAETRKAARLAALKAKIIYEDETPLISIGDARTASSFIEDERLMQLGDAEAEIAAAPLSLEGEFIHGGQDHFYLEGQIALALPGENGELIVYSSTQNPTEAQHLIAKVLGVPDNQITVMLRRMGGGFGGKET